MQLIQRLILFTSLMLGVSLSAQAAGMLIPVDSVAKKINLQSQNVTVTIEDGYAITQVDQVFFNPNSQDLAATYSFPVPEKGTVSEFTLWIDGKPVTGEVLAKKQARELYEEEKAAGRETGLTEKNAHYRFEISVSPVRANSEQRIRFVYMQAAHVDTGIGRYLYPLEEGATDDKALSFWAVDQQVESFRFSVKLRSAYPIDAMRLPAHPDAVITRHSVNEWEVTVDSNKGTQAIEKTMTEKTTTEKTKSEETTEGNYKQKAFAIENTVTAKQSTRLDKDIAVYWRLAPNLPGSVDLVTYRAPDAKRGTYMLTITPSDDLSKITEGRDWAFVLDMSGSMSGKYQTLVDGVQRALKSLNSNDRFRLIRFDDHVSELTSDWVNATPEAVQRWGKKLANTSVGGGTNLYAGLEKGFKAINADRTSAIILVTDGEANVGITEKKEFLKLMESRDVRLFTAVMGNGANRPLLNSMATVSNGFAVSVSNSDDIAGKLLEFTSKASHEAFHDVELSISGIKTRDQSPAKPTTLYRGEQMVIFGHYWGDGKATVSLKGKISGKKKVYQGKYVFPAQAIRNPEIERLWAYAQIRALQDQIDYLGEEGDYKDAIVDLAVEHGLVTNYTSMLVMRDEQFDAHGIKRQNRDRLATEAAMAEQRAASPTPSYTSNNTSTQPMFNNSRPSFSFGGGGGGGGSLGLELLVLALLLLVIQVRNYRRREA